VPVFTNLPGGGTVSGPFSINLDFGEEVTGLEPADLVVTNGTLTALGGGPDSYSLAVTPDAEGAVTIEILAGAVVDLAGNVMGAGESVILTYETTVLALEAEDGTFFGGMTIVNDGAASNGQFVWLPEDVYPGNWQTFNATHRAEYTFVVPHSGDWTLHGRVQSPGTSSDSFWVEIDGNQGAGPVYLWDTALAGTAYVWDLMNNRGGADPVVLNLSAGAHTVAVYGRDDGTRLDRLELVSERPLPTLTAPLTAVTGPFQVNVAFSEGVTGLTIADFVVTGGTATGFSGSGAAYTLTVDPASPTVAISLPADVATDVDANGNFASNAVVVRHDGIYEQWASTCGLSGAAAGLFANDDGDRWANLVEFMFNLDPTVDDCGIYDPAAAVGADGPSGLPWLSLPTRPGGENGLRVVFLRRKGAAAEGYTSIVQFSSDLTGVAPDGWVDFTGSETVESIDADWERVIIDDPFSSATHPGRFGRVKVRFVAP
ncbi:MAG: hypothetical protein HKO57_15760, partial [Akkermansiaceae bacterium]|nr:hypothetical protein [Akkermansiaceae bacterium]